MKKMKWFVLFFVVLSFGCSPDNNKSEQLSTPQIDDVESLPSRPLWLAYDDSPLKYMPYLNKYNPKTEMTEEYAWDCGIYGRKMVPCVMTSYGVLERSSTFTGGSFFAVLVTVEEGYFGGEQYQNVGYFNPEEHPK
jgi:hypothetical protein